MKEDRTKKAFEALTEVKVYKTTDGVYVEDLDSAVAYQEIENIAMEIEHSLPVVKIRPDEHYVHKTFEVNRYKQNLFLFLAQVIPNYEKWCIETLEGKRHISHMRKVVGDCFRDKKHNIINHLYFRLECLDMVKGIEYSEPYYVEHPDDAPNRIY